MNAICHVGIAPLRKTCSEGAEMVSQMLFGETCEILEEAASFYRIKMDFDQYDGWVDKLQITVTEGVIPDRYTLRNTVHTPDNLACVMGAEVELSFMDANGLDHRNLLMPGTEFTREDILGQAFKYLNTPYLWGGRSPYGIDCSGLSQVVYKSIGITIPRDTSQQIHSGRPVDLSDARDGDLAFFSKPDKTNVSHVGLVIRNKNELQILHASGWVKRELLTAEGIVNAAGDLTHRLLDIRDMIS